MFESFDDVGPDPDRFIPAWQVDDDPRGMAGGVAAFQAALLAEGEQRRTEVDDLDADGTLGRVESSRRRVNLAQADQLALAAHWADLHGVVETRVRVRGGEVLVEPGGEGTPGFGEFCRVELGAVLGVSQVSAGLLMADALDLRHRLPLLWRRVHTGDVRVWVARKVAVRTRHLSQQAAALVDERVAPLVDTVVFPRFEKVLDAAVLAADPALAARKTAETAAGQGVWLGRETDHGHGTIVAKAPMPDIAAVDATLDALARAMTILGDTDPHQLRRAKALGLLADPAAALELTRTANETLDTLATRRPHEPSDQQGTHPHEGSDPRRRCDLGPATLYVHLTSQSLTAALAGAGAGFGVVRVEGVGPVLLDQVRGWLRHRQVKVVPVIDIPGMTPVDRYEVPDRMAEAIRLRTPADCTPYSPNVSRRGDNDHTTPYIALDDGGPPGQTTVANLARITRANHRWKTHGKWTVTQPRSGTWLWTSPHHRHYLVDHNGTHNLGKLP